MARFPPDCGIFEHGAQAARWQSWKEALQPDANVIEADYERLIGTENQWTELIEKDSCRTLTHVRKFDSVQQERLTRVLKAYAAHNPELGYCQGMNNIVGLLLLVSDSERETFDVLLCLMDRFSLSGIYSDNFPLLLRYFRVFDYMFAQSMPDLRLHLQKERVDLHPYLHQWFLKLFIGCFPQSMVLALWDAVFAGGLEVMLRISLTLLHVFRARLLYMESEEIHLLLRFMKVCKFDGNELAAFQSSVLDHSSRLQISPKALAYLRNLSDDGADFEVGPATVPVTTGDPRFDFGVSFWPTRCIVCQSLTLNRGCKHEKSILCRTCYLDHLPCPFA